MTIRTEDGLILTTEADGILGLESYVHPFGKKKILEFPEIRHFEEIIKMRGATKEQTQWLLNTIFK